MSLGFEQAGFDVVAAVEVDPIHAATHHFNFPATNTLAHSVIGLDVRSIYRKGWSRLNKRGVVWAGVELLEEHGWLQVMEVRSETGDGRPSPVVRLHPDLLGQRSTDD